MEVVVQPKALDATEDGRTGQAFAPGERHNGCIERLMIVL
jgi:hypothetical protein